MPRTTRTTFKAPGTHVAQFRNKPLEIIVELEGEQISFRHKGCRKRFSMHIAEAMREAILRQSVR